MSSYLLAQAATFYQEALKATEQIEAPAVGFAKPSDYRGGVSGPSAQIKQNNTQIQLLVRISELLQEVKEDIREVKEELRQVRKQGGTTGGIPEELVSKLENLSLGTGESSSKQKEKRGELKVFKDPLKIFKEEKQR